MKSLLFPVTLRIGLGLVAGLLGGAVTQQVALAVPGLPEGAATFAYWVVLAGGLYKGLASGLSLLDDKKKD